MKTHKLMDIVLSVSPDLYHLLTMEELNLSIVLEHGLSSLHFDDVIEIIEASIFHNKENDVLH